MKVKRIKIMFRKLLAKYGSFHQRLQTRWRCLRLGIHYEKGLILGRHIRIANKTQVVFGHNCKVADDVLLWGGGTIRIGSGTGIGRGANIFASPEGGVDIGENVLMAFRAYIMDSEHGTAPGQLIKEQPLRSKKIVIHDGVWLGYNVTILMGTEIGEGSVIGACSLVKGSVPSNVIYGGVPARFLKNR